ncbi:MAG TPA: acetamidase/formamidase family protein [Verrucomicrobiota bacterium]|nr:acetamidase/formamidase family protein [Verrucomicrobiota bacterium]
MKARTLGPAATHDRWNAALPPALEAASGDVIHFDCPDGRGGQHHAGSTLADFRGLDRGRIHTIVGPVYVRDAAPGDVLEVQILRVAHRGWGWTGIIPDMGTLPARFPQPHLFVWKLEERVSRSLSPATVPLAPFLGILGVCPPGKEVLRTRPPGPFGGNLDVRDLGPGARLFLPVFQPGALFSAGDGHAAQGNGEVCLNGIEAPLEAELRLVLHKGRPLDGPFAELPPAPPPVLPDAGQWAFIASAPDALEAARTVIGQAIDFLVARFGLPPELAYTLCSVALDLRLSQIVNQPMTTVTGTLARAMFPAS